VRRHRYELLKEQRRRSLDLRTADASYGEQREVREFHVVAGPDRFSLIHNVEPFLEFIDAARSIFRQRMKIQFDLRNVKHVYSDGIAAFVAHLRDRRFTHNQRFRGVNPKEGAPSKVFVECGFYDYFHARGIPAKDTPSRTVHRVTKRRVEPAIAKAFCENAISFTFRQVRKLRPLYEVLIECMANTKNHASLDEEGQYNWWLFQYCDKQTKRTHFTFVDLGVGIFESLNIRAYKRLVQAVSGRDNTDIMKDIIDGKVQSRTGKKERGKGLPLVYKHAQNSYFDVFYIVSNDVLIDLKSRSSRRLRSDFHGTMLHWELQDTQRDNDGKQLSLWER